MKPTENAPRAKSLAVHGVLAGKNCLSNTRAEHAAKRKKSHHSKVVPSVLAKITFDVLRVVSILFVFAFDGMPVATAGATVPTDRVIS